ncbi:MAG: hypothetical protein ACOYI3_04710 [Christensenellales bacterium]|jgi:predicted amidophosphoribosyltransferase
MSNSWQKSIRKHVVICPHCQKEVLDHMTECPFCKGELKSRYYTPTRSEEETKALKKTMRIIGFAVAAVIIIVLLLKRFL